MKIEEIKPDTIIKGPFFAESVKVIKTVQMGNSLKIVGEGLESGKVHQPILTFEEIDLLELSPATNPYDGDANKFRLGIEAMRLALAYEYDPYFSLSIAKVDPLPHQLEAVYDYFLKLPRIRFLLADDPGAGKTIMAGLLIKELKVRGLIQRILIVTPASLSFQWQRELKEKFREDFKIVRSDLLRANYGSNPWQDLTQVITSVSWVARIEDANESLLRSQWDLVIVDEAHKMSASNEEKKTLAYQLGEALGERTDHYLLMTATPHKGDPKNFCLFLRLLDADVYGDIKSLEKAMENREAPFYLRRVKEALVTFPDPNTGITKSLFTKRIVKTLAFKIDDEELDFYDSLTRFVEDQSIKASQDDTLRGRALGFTMALLQRRFASSVYAVRRTMERMKLNREKILQDPEAYKQEQINRRLPDDFEDMPEEEQLEIIVQLESVVASADPDSLREEIAELEKLIQQAKVLEQREIETKLTKLRDVLAEKQIFKDPKTKLLIFTEHKETLDYLAGDGRDGRPMGKLREWGLNVTQIHGGMKIGDRDAAGTRLAAEREFKDPDGAQVMVATEAAGEGINLQFCWLMINYDIPWNPNRLEQRMGRIHRYGQEKDCLIINFVASNTREGRVMEKLFLRIEQIEKDLDPQRVGKVFNVLGEIFPANQLEGMMRDMYAHNLTEDVIKNRIVERIDTDRIKKITESTLEGLAKRELNLSTIIGKCEEAKERRLVPEVIEDFFVSGAPLTGIAAKEVKPGAHIYRLGKIPRPLLAYGDKLEPKFGKLGREYKQIVFSKSRLAEDPTLDWVTPGHPLFESVRAMVVDEVAQDLSRGAVFYDLNRATPAKLDVFSADIKDGRGNILHKKLLVMQTEVNGEMSVRQPTIFLDLSAGSAPAVLPEIQNVGRDQVEHFLYERALMPLLEDVRKQRLKEIETISKHMELSLNTIIDRVQCQFAELQMLRESESQEQGLDGRIKMLEDRLDDLNARLEKRRAELNMERYCKIDNIQQVATAWVLPHPERKTAAISHMVSDPVIEAIAIEAVKKFEEVRGWHAHSVESENRGFDLISRKPHPEDPQTAIEVRFIEVKGRSGIAEVALTTNEFKTAERLKKDYWLYVVFNCDTTPEVHVIQDPARLGWKPVVKIECYHVGANELLKAEER